MIALNVVKYFIASITTFLSISLLSPQHFVNNSNNMDRNYIKAALLAPLVLRVAAQSDTTTYGPIISIGGSNPGNLGSDEYELFEEGNTHPNATRSVTFKPFEWYTQDPEVAEREWTWRE